MNYAEIINELNAIIDMTTDDNVRLAIEHLINVIEDEPIQVPPCQLSFDDIA